MHRRPIGRSRWIVAAGAVLLVLATALQWWQIGGGPGQITAQTGNGFTDAKTYVLFVVGLAALALITLPYASEAPVAIDRPISFLILLVVGLLVFVWRAVELLQESVLPIPPTQGPGFWLAAVGLILFARGVFEVYDAQAPR